MLTRREFLHRASATTTGLALLPSLPARAETSPSKVPPFTKTIIDGKPRERGRRYGKEFSNGVRAFLDKEIWKPFTGKPATREEMVRYAAACGLEIKKFSPIIHDELEGMAEGSGLRLEELVLITLHEELYHKGALPKLPHCTAVAAGPPVTAGGGIVGQTWDWMESVFGLSNVLHWKRPEGPSLLAYAFPGLWVGAGLNSAGLALCWTSAALGEKGQEPRVGIPSYVLLTHLLYQETLDAAEAEAKRGTNAGWFTFVMGDGKGNLLNIEASPKEVVTERPTGTISRVGFGSRKMTATPEGESVKFHARCQKVNELMAGASGKVDRRMLQTWFEDPKGGIAVGKGTIDLMVFDTTAREGYLSRGPSYGVHWQKFGFADRD
jgi:hypothetical protein